MDTEDVYKPEIAIEICAKLVEGRSLRSICAEKYMPTYRTIFRWLHEQPEFEKLYLIAQENRAETLADEILDIADDASNDWIARNDPENPGWIANRDHINRSRLRVDTRKWIAAKMKPKRYGEKIEHSGELTHNYVAQPIPVEQRNSDRAVARPNGAATNGHSTG